MKLSMSNTSLGAVGVGLVLLTAAGILSVMPVFAAETPTITATAQNGSNANITSAVVGTGVHASFTVASSTSSTSPTGTVDFTLYDGVSCVGTGSIQAGVSLAGGVAKSATSTVGANGLSYRVHYNGQGDLYNPGDSNCASVSATKNSPTIAIDLSSNNIVAGASAVAAQCSPEKPETQAVQWHTRCIPITRAPILHWTREAKPLLTATYQIPTSGNS